jgi:hypothetical protein
MRLNADPQNPGPGEYFGYSSIEEDRRWQRRRRLVIPDMPREDLFHERSPIRKDFALSDQFFHERAADLWDDRDTFALQSCKQR